MSTASVLVTFSTDEERPALEEGVPPGTELQYLEDVPSESRAAAVGAADYVLTLSPARELSDAEFARLGADQVLQLVTAGVDHVPFERLPDGMQVASNAGAYAEPMAEHVLALYLALSKRLPIEHHHMQQGEFNQFRETHRVDGSVCGIFGFGAVGEATARLLKPLGVDVHAVNRRGEADEQTAFLGTPDSLDRLLRRCDGLVISAPLTPETRGRIGRDELETMTADAFLINVSRGEIVDQRALYEHLESNPAFQAGLESWWVEPVRHGEFTVEYPFLELPNVIGCPHNSAMVPGVRTRGIRHATANVRGAIESGTLGNVVDRERGY
jgi:glycerate dehydrogenase